MAAMSMFRLPKRVLATIAGIAFLLCQSVALAQACWLTAQASEGASIQQPCHGAGDESGPNTQSNVQGSCHYVFSSVPDVPVHAAVETPSLVARADQAATSMLIAAFEPPSLRVEPPPHSILHCCLRN